MENKRKLQFGAAAVMLNGVLALAGMQPKAAWACPTVQEGCNITCMTNPTAFCQALAPGCTVTEAICEYVPITICGDGTLYYCTYS